MVKHQQITQAIIVLLLFVGSLRLAAADEIAELTPQDASPVTVKDTSVDGGNTVHEAEATEDDGSAKLAASPEQPPVDSEKSKASLYDFLNGPQSLISNYVIHFSEGLDRFFASDQYYEESKGSVLRWSISDIMQRGESPVYDSRFRMKLRLPRTENKLKLLVDGGSDELPEDDLQRPSDKPGGSSTIGSTLAANSYRIALRVIFAKESPWRMNLDYGYQIKPSSEPFSMFRISRQFRFGNWLFHPSERLFWYRHSANGSSTQLHFEYPLSDNLLFRSTSEGSWYIDPEYQEWSQFFTLFHSLSRHRALSYTIGAVQDVDEFAEPVIYEPVRFHYASVKYRQRIHQDWLYYEFEPFAKAYEDNDYRWEPALLFKIEFYFGDL